MAALAPPRPSPTTITSHCEVVGTGRKPVVVCGGVEVVGTGNEVVGNAVVVGAGCVEVVAGDGNDVVVVGGGDSGRMKKITEPTRATAMPARSGSHRRGRPRP
jgi:hypothetical protein